MKVLSHNYEDDEKTSITCHGHNFHRRDLIFSDIVPDTITIFNHDKKKNDNLITSGTVPLSIIKKKNHSNLLHVKVKFCNYSNSKGIF